MTEKEGLQLCSDGKIRCFWVRDDGLDMHYHDEEWGRPQHNDLRLFEKICLEGFQAGLSWYTILKKRENFRQAFDDFDFRKIAKYDENKIEELLQNKDIVRHNGKIRATIHNAHCAINLLQEFASLDVYFWSFKPSENERFKTIDYATLMANPAPLAAHRLAKDLKKRGFKFVGPTTCYAFMQACGMVNDHIEGCAFR